MDKTPRPSKVAAVFVCFLTVGGFFATAGYAAVSAPVVNSVQNGGFEEGVFSPAGTPEHWTQQVWNPSATFTWDDTQARVGDRCARIEASAPNDACWVQTVDLTPNTNYLLSGWVKTENVARTDGVDAGAHLSLYGTWNRSAGVFGTTGWTYISMVFNSGGSSQAAIAARLGFWSGTTTGTAWFDDLQLTPILATDPHPRWKVLVLVFAQTDFTYVDDSGVSHRVTASMTDEEVTKTASVAETFVLEDIPALNSGNMVPIVTVDFPEAPLAQLSPAGDRWWPAPEDVGEELDSGYDSVIVIWDPRGVDQGTGQRVDLNNAAGLTLPTGTGQLYTSIIVDAAVAYNHRNVFKHEWGHGILFYFQAVGASPEPTVTNHAAPGQYVHCPTGEGYVWVDETDPNPVPNSIYNNASGFTHDYYSGTTATPEDPARALGITPKAWATGGPASRPLRKLQTPGEWIDTMKRLLDQAVACGDIARGRARPLQVTLKTASYLLERGCDRPADMVIRAFARRVSLLVDHDRLAAVDGDALLFACDRFADAIK